MKTLKKLIIANCTRIIEILETKEDEALGKYSNGGYKKELKNKMHELRRDTLALQNKMY